MKFTIKATNFTLTPDVYVYIEKKLNSLDKFLKHVDSPIEARVEVGKISQHHRTGNVYRAEVQIHLPGKSVRSEAVAKNIMAAINEVKDELQREFKQYKQKQATKQKKGARTFKQLLSKTL